MSIIYSTYFYVKNKDDSSLEIIHRSSVFLSISLYFNLMSVVGFMYKFDWIEIPIWSYLSSRLTIVVLFAIILYLIVMGVLFFFNLIDKSILWKKNNEESYSSSIVYWYITVSFVILLISIL